MGFGFAGDDDYMKPNEQSFPQATLIFTYGVVSGSLLVPLLGAIMFERCTASVGIKPKRHRCCSLFVDPSPPLVLRICF